MAKLKSTVSGELMDGTTKSTKSTTATKTNNKIFNLDEFDNFLGKEANKKGKLIKDFNKTRTFISTGIYILDAMLSSNLLNGGIPDNRIVGIGGESGTGKTFLALNIVKNAILNHGYEKVYYLDTEGALDKELVEKFNIPLDKLRREPISSLEDLREYLAKFIDKLKDAKEKGLTIPKILIVLDSLGNTPSKKEIEDAVNSNGKTDMTKQKVNASIFSIITADLEYLGVPLVMCNHTYKTLEMYPKEVFKGGNSGIYNSSIIMMLSKAKLSEEHQDDMDLGQTGIIVTAKSVKNRFSKPKKVKFELSFTSGANKYCGLEAFCTIENFGAVGIAKGKKFIDEDTGELTIKEGGHMYYVRHLDKMVHKKNLFNGKVFTMEVLQELHKIAKNYFAYANVDEMESQLDEIIEGVDETFLDDFNADSMFEENE